MFYLLLFPYVMARYNKKCSRPLFFLYVFFFSNTRFSPSVQYNDCWNAFYLCIRVCLYQKGLMRSPVPRGEKGLTLAHIRASLREMADLPSSSTNTGPFTSRTERERDIVKHIHLSHHKLICHKRIQTCILCPVKQDNCTSEWLGRLEPVT